jgi:hypothetical protein
MQHVAIGDGSCTAVDPADGPAGSIAAIDCRPGNAVVATLRYVLYPTPDAAEQAYSVDLAATGVTPGTGSCFRAIAGEGSFTTNHTARGRVLCHLDAAGVPSMVWVDRTLAIVGWATGTSPGLKPLCDWWASESGPG